MDKISIFKYAEKKPSYLLMLNTGGNIKCWVLQQNPELNSSRIRIAFEADSEYIERSYQLELIGEGSLSVEYSNKKKIKFVTKGLECFSGKYVFYIPSWGFHTKKKIWILIPGTNK